MITEADFLTLAFYAIAGELIYLAGIGLIYITKSLFGGNGQSKFYS